MNSSERYEQANAINNAMDTKQFKDSQMCPNKLGGQSHFCEGRSGDKDAAAHCANFESKLDGSQQCCGNKNECKSAYGCINNKKMVGF
jgi:hypothetical protein